MTKKKNNKFPRGWNEKRVKRVISHYDNQSDAQAIAEDEARVRANSRTTMHVPTRLVPKVRAMIAKEQLKRRSA